MTEPPTAAVRRLLLGTIDAEGHVDPTPVIATISPDGNIASWTPLTGHEPHSTTPLRALLSLPSATLHLLP